MSKTTSVTVFQLPSRHQKRLMSLFHRMTVARRIKKPINRRVVVVMQQVLSSATISQAAGGEGRVEGSRKTVS